jgi:hypothetical protein
MLASDELWGFLERLLGWTSGRAVDHALRSIDLAVSHRAALVLCGEGDLVPIAHALHRRTLGADRPFIVCDPRRENTPGSVRSPANFKNGVSAFEAAREGSLCVRNLRLPRDFSSMVALVRDPGARIAFIVCSDRRIADGALLTVPVPINVPSLKDRASELPRIIDEYAHDAVAALGASPTIFTDNWEPVIRACPARQAASAPTECACLETLIVARAVGCRSHKGSGRGRAGAPSCVGRSPVAGPTVSGSAPSPAGARMRNSRFSVVDSERVVANSATAARTRAWSSRCLPTSTNHDDSCSR